MNEPTGNDRTLREAEFLPSAPMYHTVQASIACVVLAVIILIAAIPTVGIALIAMPIPIGLFFLIKWYYTKYYDRMSCVLTDRKLLIGRGVWNRTEQAVPMDKITDMQMNQTFVMRWLDLEAIKIETAGQSNMVGGLTGIVGIKDSRGFREAVLAQRDKVVGTADRGDATVSSPAHAEDQGVLVDIRDTLKRIETHLERTSGDN